MDTEKLRQELAKRLPYYMIPSFYVKIDQVPLKTNGKLDRMALPKPSLDSMKNDYAEPETEIQKKLCQAFEQVLSLTRSYSRIRQENQYLKSFGQDPGEQLIVLGPDGSLDYYTGTQPSDAMLELLRPHISQVIYGRVSQFFINHSSRLYQVSARKLSGDAQDMTIFRCHTYLIPAVAKNHGIRVVGNVECAHLFQQSFFSLRGAMGELEQKVKSIASTGQSVMILGEPGTGKVQIARALYLYSNQPSQPMISIDCDLMSERSWDFLFDHDSSPLSDQHGTIYFQHLASIPPKRQIQLLAALAETNLPNRMQLLFSCSFSEGRPLDRVAALILDRIGCQVLSLPTLRSRQDEIPSLASLYLASLNMELGKQIIGPEADASRMMQRYDWPGNYMQFKQILGELAVLTDALLESTKKLETHMAKIPKDPERWIMSPPLLRQ